MNNENDEYLEKLIKTSVDLLNVALNEPPKHLPWFPDIKIPLFPISFDKPTVPYLTWNLKNKNVEIVFYTTDISDFDVICALYTFIRRNDIVVLYNDEKISLLHLLNCDMTCHNNLTVDGYIDDINMMIEYIRKYRNK